MIDQANAWSSGSHAGYQSGLRRFSRFHSDFGVPILHSTPLVSPPRSPSIGMMWTQQQYATQTLKGRHSQNSDRFLFQTARLLRSAGAYFYAWDHHCLSGSPPTGLLATSPINGGYHSCFRQKEEAPWSVMAEQLPLPWLDGDLFLQQQTAMGDVRTRPAGATVKTSGDAYFGWFRLC